MKAKLQLNDPHASKGYCIHDKAGKLVYDTVWPKEKRDKVNFKKLEKLVRKIFK